MALPKVRLGEPESKDNFTLYEIGSIKIYVSNILVSKENKIHLKLNSFLGFKNIEVHGFEIF